MTKERISILLNELRALPKETEWFEFKENNYNPEEIGQYLSALSNSACLHDKAHGYLIFGINNETHLAVGTIFEPHNEKVGNEDLEAWLARLLEPRIDFKIYMLNYQDKNIVVFEVDAAHSRPVKFSGTEYIRIGSYKKKLSEYPEKERKIWSKHRQLCFEDEIALKNVTTDTIFKILDYSVYFKLFDLPLPERQIIINKFEEEHFIIKSLDKYHITNLGAILFANKLSDFENISRKAPRVIIYKGKNRLSAIKEQTGAMGYAVGFKGMIDFINNQLPMNEEIGKVFRKEVKMYPEIAIRELVANALIHQDFSESGSSPMIEIFEDRIEISNPGTALIEPLRFIDHTPKSRNEKLAGFMRRIKICEERGSGIDKVIDAVERFQLPAPNIIQGNSDVRVILYAYKTLKQMDKQDKIRACYQHCCLKYVSNESMTNQTLRDRFKITEENYPVASKIISETIEADLIKDYDPESNSRKYAKYIPFWA